MIEMRNQDKFREDMKCFYVLACGFSLHSFQLLTGKPRKMDIQIIRPRRPKSRPRPHPQPGMFKNSRAYPVFGQLLRPYGVACQQMGVRCDGFVLSRSQAGNILLAQKLAASTRDDTHVAFHGIQSLIFHVYKLRENTKTAQLNAGVHHSPSPLLWERAQSLWASPGISRKAPRLLSSPTRSRASLYVK